MCLLTFAYDVHPDYRFVFVGNRDEFYTRPSEPAHFWEQHPDFLAGRDSEAGGTWLGVTRNARFAVVTNYREPSVEPKKAQRSRGLLVTEFLTGSATAAEYAAEVFTKGDVYNGFSLIVADSDACLFLSNRDPAGPRQLGAGVYSLSNHILDTPWPKVERATRKMREFIAADVSTDALLDLLADTSASDEPLQQTGLEPEVERALSSMFVVTPTYGTRCATALTIGNDGQIQFAERSFDATGSAAGEKLFVFDVKESLTSR